MPNGHLFHLKLKVFIIYHSCSCLLCPVRDCESGCKSCITRSARLKISTQNTSVTYDVSRARQSGGGAPTPLLAPATNSAMSVPAPAIRWKQFIRERERERCLVWAPEPRSDLCPGNSREFCWTRGWGHQQLVGARCPRCSNCSYLLCQCVNLGRMLPHYSLLIIKMWAPVPVAVSPPLRRLGSVLMWEYWPPVISDSITGRSPDNSRPHAVTAISSLISHPHLITRDSSSPRVDLTLEPGHHPGYNGHG